MRIRTGLFGSLVALTLVVSGCGSEDPEQEPETSSSVPAGDGSKGAAEGPCGLLDEADLQKALGASFDEAELTHEGTGVDECVWTSAEGSPVQTFSMNLLREDGLEGDLKASGMSVPELFEQTKAAYPNAEVIDLGDEGYVAATEVQVLDGDAWYSFSLHGGEDGVVDGVKELAAQVVG